MREKNTKIQEIFVAIIKIVSVNTNQSKSRFFKLEVNYYLFMKTSENYI